MNSQKTLGGIGWRGEDQQRLVHNQPLQNDVNATKKRLHQCTSLENQLVGG